MITATALQLHPRCTVIVDEACASKLKGRKYYRWIFENAVPGLPAAAAKENLTALAYMRKYGAFLVEQDVFELHKKAVTVPAGAETDASGVVRAGGKPVGVEIDGIGKVLVDPDRGYIWREGRRVADWGRPVERAVCNVVQKAFPEAELWDGAWFLIDDEYLDL